MISDCQAVEQVLNQELTQNIHRYSRDNILTQQFWTWLQPSFQCCGVMNRDDWTGVAGLEDNWSVPESCCNQPDLTKKGKKLSKVQIQGHSLKANSQGLGLGVTLFYSAKF